MNDLVIKSLSGEQKLWFAYAIAGMITADGTVDDNEIAYLKEAINFLESREEIKKIVDMVKNRKEPSLQPVDVNKDLASRMMFYLAEISITDGQLSKGEVVFFQYLGKRLNISDSTCLRMIGWANDFYKLKNRKMEILKEI